MKKSHFTEEQIILDITGVERCRRFSDEERAKLPWIVKDGEYCKAENNNNYSRV